MLFETWDVTVVRLLPWLVLDYSVACFLPPKITHQNHLLLSMVQRVKKRKTS